MKNKTSNDTIEILKQVAFFGSYKNNNAVLQIISKLCKRKSFPAGKSIITEGETGDEMFIFINGTIDILKRTLQNEPYTVTTLDSSSGPVYVGELALIDNDRRSASVIAQTDCDCLVLTRNDFIAFGNKYPDVALNITRKIAQKISSSLRKSTEDIITLFSALVDEISEEDID